MLLELLPVDYERHPKEFVLEHLNPTNIFILFVTVYSELARSFGLEEDLYSFLGKAASIPILLAVPAAWVIWKLVLQGTGITEGNANYRSVQSFVLVYVLAFFQVIMISTVILSNFTELDKNALLLVTFYLATFAYHHLQKITAYMIKRSDTFATIIWYVWKLNR